MSYFGSYQSQGQLQLIFVTLAPPIFVDVWESAKQVIEWKTKQKQKNKKTKTTFAEFY